MRTLVAAAALAPLPAADGRTWSDLTMGPCSATDKYQQFTVQQSSSGRGTIVDRETGRCAAVKDCDVSLKGGAHGAWQYGVVVLDDCDAVSACSQWTAVPESAPGKALFKASEEEDGLSFLLNAVGTPDGFNGNPVTPEDWAAIDKKLPRAEWVLAYGMPTASGFSGLEGTNSEWGYDASTGQVRVSQAADLLGKTACKDAIENCCLIAKPCSWPCNALGDGWLFILLLTLGAAGYLGGGALHAHKTQGKTLAADGWQAMVPHRARWVELGALVQDGIQFSRARLRGVDPPPGGGGSMDAALLAPVSDERREQKESGGGGKKKRGAGKKRSKQKRSSGEGSPPGSPAPAPAPAPAADPAPAAGTAAGDGGKSSLL